MVILGMLCPHCGERLNCDPPHEWLYHWIGFISWACCEPCERFFYVLSGEDSYPVTVIDAEHGIGEGDDGYSFDQDHDDDEGWYYYQQWKAKQPKCAICGVRKPLESCDRCQRCVDRFGVGEAVLS